jgi:hypothetical protein
MAVRSLEAELAALRDDKIDRADAIAALRGNIGVVVAEAELAPAFERLCDQAVKRDPGCRAELAAYALATTIRDAASERDARLRDEIVRTIKA